MSCVLFGGLVKSRKCSRIVIPVKTGIQKFQRVTKTLDTGACPGPDPGFTGVTTFYEFILFGLQTDPLFGIFNLR